MIRGSEGADGVVAPAPEQTNRRRYWLIAACVVLAIGIQAVAFVALRPLTLHGKHGDFDCLRDEWLFYLHPTEVFGHEFDIPMWARICYVYGPYKKKTAP